MRYIYCVMSDKTIKEGCYNYVQSTNLVGVYSSYKMAREVRDEYNNMYYKPKEKSYRHYYILKRVLNTVY